MDLSDVNAVIASARARDGDSLVRFLEGRLPESPESEILDAASLCEEIIDSLPVFLARAWQAAGERHVETVVEPILEQATAYLLSPVDVLPEMTLGLAGLLDDAYLVLRLLEHLDGGAEDFLDWQLKEPLTLLRRILGPDTVAQLDAHVAAYVDRAEAHFAEAWASFSAQA